MKNRTDKTKPMRGPGRHVTVQPLSRPPRTDLKVRIQDLDRLSFQAMDMVVGLLKSSMERSLSLETIQFLGAKAHMLMAMQSTHRSIRKLVQADQDQLDLSVDALSLTRVQLERCLLALLLDDNPARWFKRYRKNAWKVFAEKYFRDQQALEHLEPFRSYFGPQGEGISLLRAFAREMGVCEDELQTVRIVAKADKPETRWAMRYIVQMPPPGRIIEWLNDPNRKRLAEILFPYYNNLSHFSHGGLAGIMEAGLLRPDSTALPPDGRGEFFRRCIMEETLPPSYVTMLATTTLFAIPFLEQEGVRGALVKAWQPYHSDGSVLGVAVWDNWAKMVLHVAAPPQEGENGRGETPRGLPRREGTGPAT